MKMSTEGKRALIAAVRKVVFAGLILLVVWLILLALMGAIPARTIEQLNAGMQTNRSPWIPVPGIGQGLCGEITRSHR